MKFDLLINALKGQFNTLNLILLLFMLSFLFNRLQKKRLSFYFLIFATTGFLLFSTSYLPGYLVNRIEARYSPFDIDKYPHKQERTFVHVLGAGYTADPRLPPSSQMSHVSLGRLSEGIRIGRLLDKSILVVSGNVASGDSSMAWVAKESAMAVGFDSARIEMFKTPSTTREEAKAFADAWGRKVHVIVVTDAIHMARAMRFFNEYGVDAYPAPTNYLIKHDDNPFALRWMPSVENFLLMDRVFREFLGSLKGNFSAR